MKAIKVLLVLLMIISLGNCKNEEETVENNNPGVEDYIKLLKSNQYESFDLPAFNYVDIPALLVYINDNTEVNKFPYSPISSYAPPHQEYRLGVLVSWTIESIRVVSCGNNAHIFRFPSQHPFVQTKSEPIEWITDHDDEVYNSIRQAYINWWSINKNKNFSNFCNIDPLENTNYSWH